MNDLNVVGQAQHVAGGTAMKVGSGITVFSAVSTWLTDNADLIGVIAILIGTAIGIAGFIHNRRMANCRERREQIEHELRVERMKAEARNVS